MIHNKNYLSSGPYGKPPLHATTMSDDKLIAKVIVENASRHTKLLSSIAELEDAPHQLAQNSQTVSELRGQVEECEAKVERLSEKAKQERTKADNNERFGSAFKFWKGKNKSSDGSSKRSLEAMQDEMRERDKLSGLQRALSAAEAESPELKARAYEYEYLDAQLDALYGLVFSGPTPEDALEQQVAAARSVHQRVQVDLQTEMQTLELLVRAERTMREAHSKLKDSIYWATALAMLAGGRSAEMKEVSALKSAHSLARRAEMEYNECQMKSTHVRFLERSKLAKELPQRKEGNNTFHEDLTQLSNELSESQNQITTERKAAQARVTSTSLVANQAEQTLNEYRRELNAARRAIFEEIVDKVNNGQYNLDEREDGEVEGLEDAPPSYDSPHPQPSPLELAKYVQYMSLGGGDISVLSGGMAHFQRNNGSVGSSRLASPTLDTTFLNTDPYGDDPVSPLSPATSIMSASTSMSRSNTIDSSYWRASSSSSSSSRRPLPRPPQDR
ncbi:hypothetical protein VKT23_006427 [Stygiomarasmius scandens]|uniref:Uncharacterized protein n=1 Tax=Marasmiellus scandens TaxID=2682957 RepID=A0ABR1JTF6_9AGAR